MGRVTWGRTVSGLTCLVGAHDAGTRASVGGLLCVAGAGARGADRRRGPLGLSSPRQGSAMPAGGRRRKEAGSLFPLAFSRCAFGGGPSRSFFFFFFAVVCLLSNPQSLQVGGTQWALAAASDRPPPRDPTSRSVPVPVSLRGPPVRPCRGPGPSCARAGPGDGCLPGATPYGPGLNLDSAREPETRERGREAGKTRRPGAHQGCRARHPTDA